MGAHGPTTTWSQNTRGWNSRPDAGGPEYAWDSARAGLWALPSWGLTMVVVLAAWVFFRAPSFSVAWNVFAGIAAWKGKLVMADVHLVVFTSLWLLVFEAPAYRRKSQTAFLNAPWWVRGFVYGGSVLAMVFLERKPEASFIYFQF